MGEELAHPRVRWRYVERHYRRPTGGTPQRRSETRSPVGMARTQRRGALGEGQDGPANQPPLLLAASKGLGGAVCEGVRHLSAKQKPDTPTTHPPLQNH